MSSIDQTKPLCRRLDPVLLLPLVSEMRNKERSVLCVCFLWWVEALAAGGNKN